MCRFAFWDKTIRLLLGAAFIYFFGFICDSWWWLFGAWLIITAVYGCPLYRYLPWFRDKCKNN